MIVFYRSVILAILGLPGILFCYYHLGSYRALKVPILFCSCLALGLAFFMGLAGGNDGPRIRFNRVHRGYSFVALLLILFCLLITNFGRPVPHDAWWLYDYEKHYMMLNLLGSDIHNLYIDTITGSRLFYYFGFYYIPVLMASFHGLLSAWQYAQFLQCLAIIIALYGLYLCLHSFEGLPRSTSGLDLLFLALITLVWGGLDRLGQLVTSVEVDDLNWFGLPLGVSLPDNLSSLVVTPQHSVPAIILLPAIFLEVYVMKRTPQEMRANVFWLAVAISFTCFWSPFASLGLIIVLAISIACLHFKRSTQLTFIAGLGYLPVAICYLWYFSSLSNSQLEWQNLFTNTFWPPSVELGHKRLLWLLFIYAIEQAPLLLFYFLSNRIRLHLGLPSNAHYRCVLVLSLLLIPLMTVQYGSGDFVMRVTYPLLGIQSIVCSFELYYLTARTEKYKQYFLLAAIVFLLCFSGATGRLFKDLAIRSALSQPAKPLTYSSYRRTFSHQIPETYKQSPETYYFYHQYFSPNYEKFLK